MTMSQVTTTKTLLGLLFGSVLVLLISFLSFSALIAQANRGAILSTIKNSAATENVQTNETIALPSRLHIPAINLNAKVQYVGLDAKNRMGIPSNYTDVGWYQYGSLPGRVGSAVIAGHVDTYTFEPGVFRDLKNLKAGDLVYVEDETGTMLEFIVLKIAEYSEDDAPLETIFNTMDKPRLNLITCTGDWQQSVKRYDKRLVVYTELVR